MFTAVTFTLVNSSYYFHKIYSNDPPGNTPLSENDPPKPITIFKMTPGRNPPITSPPSRHLTGNLWA